jgi:Transposase DNA-binding
MGLLARLRAARSDRAGAAETWVDAELTGCKFRDERLGRRLRKLLQQIGSDVGQSIPLVCQDWANTKAAYRFLSNDRVSEREILTGHFRSTGSRAAAADGTILVLHDTTEFTFQREKPQSIGFTHTTSIGRKRQKDIDRLKTPRAICGILMHSSLAITTEGLPLGLAAIKFWTRKKFKGTKELKRHIHPTRVCIEKKESVRWLENLTQSTELIGDPDRCVHIGDRESDIYELFCTAVDNDTHFLVRTCADRLAGEGDHTIADEMNEVGVKGLHTIEVRNKSGERSEALLELKYRRISVLPPLGKQKRYPGLTLTVIHATERGEPKNREKIHWKLITDLPIHSRKEAIEKLEWYAMRWKIEVFHKILKSGCRAEQSKLRTAERLVNLISVFCILSWRIFWMTMVNRSDPNSSPTLALTQLEIRLLDRLLTDKGEKSPGGKKTISSYLVKIARLGGYLARKNDPPPGNMVMWRGLSRLSDLTLGAVSGAEIMGK